MERASKLMVVVVVAALGVWGCARGPANSAGQSERVHTLEGKCAKLEEDYRAVAAARDEARKRAASLEDERNQLKKDVENQKAKLQKEQDVHRLLVKERDELRQQLEARTGERDLMQARCDRLKKGIQNLIGQDDAYLSAPAPLTPPAPTLGN